ncbi:hypothetical protein MKX01_030300 [Papaver californicum]|nr:hypothetical protein MKX01_030300 [Papaver californicum]
MVDDCRPLGFLLGMPFALFSSVLSLIALIVWLLGSIVSCICPCCKCCAGLLNLTMTIAKLPVEVIRWFISKIPL